MQRPENINPEMEAYCAYIEKLSQEAREELLARYEWQKQRGYRILSEYFKEFLKRIETEKNLKIERQRHALTRATRNRVIKEREKAIKYAKSIERASIMYRKLMDKVCGQRDLARAQVVILKAEIERLNAQVEHMRDPKPCPAPPAP